MGHIERVLGASWRLLKASWKRLGSVLEVLEGVLEVVGDVLEAEMSQDCQERAKNKIPLRIAERTEAPRIHPGGSWGHLERFWGRLEGS